MRSRNPSITQPDSWDVTRTNRARESSGDLRRGERLWAPASRLAGYHAARRGEDADRLRDRRDPAASQRFTAARGDRCSDRTRRGRHRRHACQAGGARAADGDRDGAGDRLRAGPCEPHHGWRPAGRGLPLRRAGRGRGDRRGRRPRSVHGPDRRDARRSDLGVALAASDLRVVSDRPRARGPGERVGVRRPAHARRRPVLRGRGVRRVDAARARDRARVPPRRGAGRRPRARRSRGHRERAPRPTISSRSSTTREGPCTSAPRTSASWACRSPT